LRDVGASLSPFNAFLLIQGLETLPQRMDNHVSSAKVVAEYLASHRSVAEVRYAGLASSPSFDLARRYLPKGPGAVLSFRLAGGREAASRFVEQVDLLSHVANVGDVRSLVIHPASTTHRQLSDEALAAAGVPSDLVRISVGLEDLDDILFDIDQALEKVSP
jgi:O-acetylhomoserine (thiol)-lyase